MDHGQSGGHLASQRGREEAGPDGAEKGVDRFREVQGDEAEEAGGSHIPWIVHQDTARPAFRPAQTDTPIFGTYTILRKHTDSGSQ